MQQFTFQNQDKTCVVGTSPHALQRPPWISTLLFLLELWTLDWRQRQTHPGLNPSVGVTVYKSSLLCELRFLGLLKRPIRCKFR